MATPALPESERRRLVEEAKARWSELARHPISLDLTRGKPCAEQLDLSAELLRLPKPGDFVDASGTDCRNYGGQTGLPAARALCAEILGVDAKSVVAAGNSSLALMYESLVHAVLQGVPGGDAPWSTGRRVVLCPSPGYDRHFAVTGHLGFEMVPVEISDAGLDVEAIARLAAEDAAVKAIWIVPKYSNPTGLTLSPDEVRALARMKTRAPDFRILWDNAYAVHDLYDEGESLACILEACAEAGHPDRPFLYGSTSKITFAGAGVACFAASERNLAWFTAHDGKTTIGPDKLNQLRHVRFFEQAGGLRAHMRRHAEILRPKFERVQSIFESELGPLGCARWTRPRGGYFISLDVGDGLASKVVGMAAEVGLKLTPAGATFPLGVDPRDRNIRIAPSFPSLAELEQAARIVATAVICASEGRPV